MFGSICRHECPQRFLNLKHGERCASKVLLPQCCTDISISYRLSYAIFMLKKLKSSNSNLQYIILYDIACTLRQHLMVSVTCYAYYFVSYVYNFCRIEGIKTFWKEYSLVFLLFMFMVMVQNVKYDSMFCFIHILCKQPFQLLYSPRSLEHCGLTDGEATERLWSYLRRLGKITKEMRPSHRIDVLTSGLIHYASKACWKLGIIIG